MAFWAAGINGGYCQTVSLDGEWELQIDDKSAPENITDGIQVTVPHTYNLIPTLEDYAGKATYSRPLPEFELKKGERLWINFKGVYHDARVFVNNKEAGAHLNAGYTPFTLEITDLLTTNGENTLTVESDNSFSDSNFPYKRKFDWNNDGGIYRSVNLKKTGPLAIRYAHVTPSVDLNDSTAKALIEIRLRDNAPAFLNCRIEIADEGGKIIVDQDFKLKRDKDMGYRQIVDCGKIKLWHFDDPNLYSLDVKIDDNGQLSDIFTDKFGFRTFEIVGNRFHLNGEPVRLPGIEDMPGSNPDYGAAEPKEYMDLTARRMKDLNTTMTRYHWAQDDYRLHLADSLGFLVQEELSWWQEPYKNLTPELKETAREQLSELIEAHYNHPSIWGWGISNEVADNQAEALELAEHIRSLDSTRIVDVVSNRLYKQLENDPSMSLDLPTWNEYIGTWHAKHRDELHGYFNKVDSVLDGRPVMIMEAGLCEPAFSGGDTRRIDEMIYHINEWKSHESTCGYIYFCLEDYRTQMGEEGIGKHRIRRHGVCDKYLNPKPSYHVLKQLMCPLEVTAVKPHGADEKSESLAERYDLDADKHSMSISMRVKDDIPSYTLRGYYIEYEDFEGKNVVVDMPNMHPGITYDINIRDINPTYAFEVKRKNGSTVLKY